MAGVNRDDNVPGGCFVHSWELTTADPNGIEFEQPGAADRSVEFVGSNWGGATAVLEGRIKGGAWFVLTDPQGNALSKTDNALEAVMENVRFYRARLSTPGTGAIVSVAVISRSTMR
jgi:hypothetical protein